MSPLDSRTPYLLQNAQFAQFAHPLLKLLHNSVLDNDFPPVVSKVCANCATARFEMGNGRVFMGAPTAPCQSRKFDWHFLPNALY